MSRITFLQCIKVTPNNHTHTKKNHDRFLHVIAAEPPNTKLVAMSPAMAKNLSLDTIIVMVTLVIRNSFEIVSVTKAKKRKACYCIQNKLPISIPCIDVHALSAQQGVCWKDIIRWHKTVTLVVNTRP